MCDVSELVRFFRGHRRVAVLTGAGCSTESGIPDYRGPETARRARNPIKHNAFVGDDAARQRYWARSVLGWPRVDAARPNPAHQALAKLERGGWLSGLVTQNVDGLHHKAGSNRVVELHGSLGRVLCLSCGALDSRRSLQRRLTTLNPGWLRSDRVETAPTAPDGDADLTEVVGFRVAPCARCGGALKPDVVFFGDNVPRPRVEEAWSVVRDARALLVVGSSLTVYSGLRFVRGSAREGRPVALLNLGPTRGDPHIALKVHGKAGEILPQVAAQLLGPQAAVTGC